MNSEKRSEASMRDVISAVAGVPQWNENRKSWLSKAARRAGVSSRTAKALWYGEITDPEHKAARRMKEAAERNGKQEADKLANQFDSIAQALQVTDQDFHRDTIAALVCAARALRGVGSPGSHGKTLTGGDHGLIERRPRRARYRAYQGHLEPTSQRKVE